MNKTAFELSPIKAGLAAAGTGAMGGIAGYTVAREKARKALANQAQEFAVYNEQENQAIADDAFNQGAEYAVTTKQSNLKGDLMQKEAGKARDAYEAFKEIYLNGIRSRRAAMGVAKMNVKNALTANPGMNPLELKALRKAELGTARGVTRPGLYKNLAAIGATGAGVGGAGYLGMRKQSALEKLSAVDLAALGKHLQGAGGRMGPESFVAKKQVLKDTLKNMFYGGFGARKHGLGRIKTLESGSVGAAEREEIRGIRSGYRKHIAGNVAAMGGAGLGVGAMGMGAYDMSKRSHAEKVAAVADVLKNIYTGGFKLRSAFNKGIKEKGVSSMSHLHQQDAKAAYRQEIAKNLLAMAGTAGVLGGAGYGVSQAM